MGTSRQHYIPEMLAHHDLFRCLSVNQLAAIAEGAQEREVSRGEFLYQKGESPAGVSLVIAGQIKLVLTNPAGMETIVLMAGPGETFGEEAVFPGRCAPVNAQANKESLLITLKRGAIMDMALHCPEFSSTLMARMGRRVCQLIENLETCVQRSSTQRVAHFLSQRAPEEAGSYQVELDMNKSTIASHLNLAPETFSRVLNRLSKEGLIDLKGRHIMLRNVHSLRSYAG
ncbi:MAG: Crp/Fnr family transcriptional regulator [Pseudomonadota bacterium]